MQVGVLYTTVTRYGVLRRFMESLLPGLAGDGVTVMELNRVDADLSDLDALVWFNYLDLGYLRHVAPAVSRLVCLLVDNPVHHGWVQHAPDNICFGVIDKSHAELLTHLGKRSFVYYHGGSTAPFVPWERRSVDVLLAGSFEHPNSVYKRLKELPSALRALAAASVERWLQSPDASGYQVFRDVVTGRYGAAFHLHQVAQLALVAFPLAERLVRALHRLAFVNSLREFPLVVVGTGEWEMLDLHPDTRLLGAVDFDEVVRLMSQSRIVACPYTGLTQGSHERVLTALGCGAVAVTTPSTFFREQFSDGRHLRYVAPDDYSTIPAEVTAILRDGAKWESVAMAGQAAVHAGHTWAHRGQLVRRLLLNGPESLGQPRAGTPQGLRWDYR